MNVYEALEEWYWLRKMEVLRENPVSMSFYRPQILNFIERRL